MASGCSIGGSKFVPGGVPELGLCDPRICTLVEKDFGIFRREFNRIHTSVTAADWPWKSRWQSERAAGDREIVTWQKPSQGICLHLH